MKYCLKCGTEVETDDNFCPNCGHWTIKGYSFLKEQNNGNDLNYKVVKTYSRLGNLFFLLVLFMLLSIGLCFYRNKDIMNLFVYMKRQFLNYKYGYTVTVLENDNQYYNQNISTLESAILFIKQDYETQNWQCKNWLDVKDIEYNLSKKHDIPIVDFCDMTKEKAEKISEIINEVYNLFPSIKGYLTNISITNSNRGNDFVAYFQPMHQFVNSTNNFDTYNKVNKTEILLNSYYFINEDNNQLKQNWYVKDSTLESLIVHEFGHYITFVSLLKENNINSVVLETKDNYQLINDIKIKVNNRSYSKQIVEQAINNFNIKYNASCDIQTFTGNISNYAQEKDTNGEFIYDEIIAEAIHDYYLHRENSSKESLEIVSIIISKLG